MTKYLFIIVSLLTLSACFHDDDETGVCVSSPAILGNTYCYNNFTSSECSDYSAQDVNGGSPWFFHAGQTCAERGLFEGSN